MRIYFVFLKVINELAHYVRNLAIINFWSRLVNNQFDYLLTLSSNYAILVSLLNKR
ncbi:hypothetical protein Aeh1fORF03c [Aeromonas phage Aeh1]|uniref:Uncharacterized protein n=1 Tax=Aeromonas phage Aeh1 TaxID=2880362 RepID=Q76Y96_9CAUD|nr:hypothetical protein Aeh1p349 [Aeromonas phage Aeh1]AAQ17999.1 hypothetical protein Aeh1fORF03c [Aeromonas phage Aeh1]